MTDVRARLEQEYGGSLPAGLAALSESDQETLVLAIEAARTRQSEALKKATENGLSFIPKLLRGPVKKVLFG